MFCPNCGESINKGNKFCSNCGRTIDINNMSGNGNSSEQDIVGKVFTGDDGKSYIVTNEPDKKVLHIWRIALIVASIIWLCIAGDIAEGIARGGISQLIIIVILYTIFYKLIEVLIYRPFVFPKICGLPWSKENDKIIHGK